MSSRKRYLIGIDEAGRGPLAGPVAVGVALVPIDFDWMLLPGVNDSKQLSESRREEIFAQSSVLQAEGKICLAVAQVSAGVIDRIGIVPAVRLAMKRGLRRIEKNVNINTNIPTQARVLLDGGLTAPAEYKDQATIIKGDSKEPVIGLASIMAKVTRDRYMCSQATKPAFAAYEFATHKGYGTKQHRAAITKHGLSALHRRSFCSNIGV